MSVRPSRPLRAAAVVAGGLAVVTAASACGGSSSGSAGSKTVNLVAYSVPKPAYDALATAFAATPDGKGVKVASSYGPSGTQAAAVTTGQKADFVNFSTGGDMSKLVPAQVKEGWDSGATKGIVSDSVVVIVVRKGNPKHITGWDDLVKPGIKIVTPSPASSGSAKWNILAAMTHVTAEGGSEQQAEAYLKQFYANVVSKPASGSLATSTFTNGTGDALISYESEAIGGRQKGLDFDYVVPKESFLIETPAALTTKASPAAQKFYDYVMSPAGQKIFASKGFRPAAQGVDPGTVKGANDPSQPYPTVAKLTTIGDLGGWKSVNDKYFDKTNGIVTKIEAGQG